jgi:RecJ-like exonuclease
MEIAADAEIGKVYRGRVERIVDFGAFINILPGKDGLVHISQLAHERVRSVSDVVREGEDHLSEMEPDEEDRLDTATGLTLHSRLGCQAIAQGDVVVEVGVVTAGKTWVQVPAVVSYERSALQ